MQTSTHLTFNGNCREAFKWYAEIFGGTIVFAMTYGESPMATQVAVDWRDKIAHARLDFGRGYILGADPPPNYYRAAAGFDVMVAVSEPEEAERIFNILARDGTIRMPCGETFWARRFGMCVDRFGIPWMVNCEKPLDAVAASARRAAG
ncbi:MAG TPA: glyoxalase/bleomycin resistance/extradiol dioxygenase family protein [Steroidobacteraceae bacterium]|nr:glyoxalase/bleomycin resistance/extradiol dioxygenase family protein [Steroidobacteraceae bacterium]